MTYSPLLTSKHNGKTGRLETQGKIEWQENNELFVSSSSIKCPCIGVIKTNWFRLIYNVGVFNEFITVQKVACLAYNHTLVGLVFSRVFLTKYCRNIRHKIINKENLLFKQNDLSLFT